MEIQEDDIYKFNSYWKIMQIDPLSRKIEAVVTISVTSLYLPVSKVNETKTQLFGQWTYLTYWI